MNSVIKDLFNLQDYKLLNPDLKFIDDNEYIEHYKNKGKEEMRLCNRQTLEVKNEYGNENILYIPYYYYLYNNNLLFDNKIITYKGMRSHYFFLPDNQIIEKEEKRFWINPKDNSLPINYDEHVYEFNMKFWYPPNYKQYYNTLLNRNMFSFINKEIIIINNKYNIEYYDHIMPQNFFDLKTLEQIFNVLTLKYQIIYVRLLNNNKFNVSQDHNKNLDFDDINYIKNNFNDIIIFDDLFNTFPNYMYNDLKIRLFSICDNYISVQGGGAHFISYFAKKLLIYHVDGKETQNNSYNGWYKKVCLENNLNISVTQKKRNIISRIREMF